MRLLFNSSIDDFKNKSLDDMVAVGLVQPHSVRLWLRSRQPGRIKVRWWREGQEGFSGEMATVIPVQNERDNTCSIRIPGAASPPLRPLQRYRFRVFLLDDNRLIGEGRFETAPENVATTPAKFSIALLSCHQPFDKHGKVRKEAEQMLQSSLRCLEEHDTKLVMLVGDQMYSDFPKPLSLFTSPYFGHIAPSGRKKVLDCSVSEIRQLYHRRYRHFWQLPAWRTLQSTYPCYPVIDDHDIVDNWGSDPAHQTSEWQTVGEGARGAYFDYQGSRIESADDGIPKSFHYSFCYGHTSCFAMDIRSERNAGEGGRLYSDVQERALKNFLEANSDQELIFIVLSVPVIHLPRFLASTMARLPPAGEDFSDRWSSGGHLRDRDRFLKTIYAHQNRFPSQRLILLSGDIHIGCAHRIQWRSQGPVAYQLISSPITHHNGLFVQLGSKLLIRANRKIVTGDKSLRAAVRLLDGTGRQTKNPYGGLNLGLVEICTPAPGARPKIRLSLFGHKGKKPICIYRSSEI